MKDNLIDMTELRQEVRKRRWAELLDQGKEFEIVQEQMQLSAENQKVLADNILKLQHECMNDYAFFQQQLDFVFDRLERIEQTLKLEPLEEPNYGDD
tara:strand:- start:328 stop:618 length:291 start_codon:yes stop_codon:yes gene_type:complete